MNKIKRSSGQYSRSRRTGASRSGGMLILVLVIMGVGFILITSALSITIASRNRFYNDAQRSQARLTVTSAAQSVVDAILITQEITDTRIEAWATAGETLPIKSAAGYGFIDAAVSQYSVAPAIGDASADANTSVKFGKLGTQITMDFVTKIDVGLDSGGATEKLLVVLKEKPPVVPINGFTSMIKAGTPSSTNDFPRFNVGYDFVNKNLGVSDIYAVSNKTPHDSIYNYIVLHGESHLASSGDSQYYADVIFTDHVTTGSGSGYYGDVVFWGDNAGIAESGGNGIQTPGDIYFLGITPGVASAYQTLSGVATSWTYLKGSKLYVRNTTFKTDFGGAISGVVFPSGMYIDANSVAHYGKIYNNPPSNYYNVHSTNVSGGVSRVTYDTGSIGYVNRDSDATLAQLRSNAEFYYGDDMEAAITRTVPSTAEAEAMVDYATEAAVKANAEAITNLSTNKVFTGPNYYIDASLTKNLSAHLTFDLSSNDITLYIIGSGNTLTINEKGKGGLVFTNGGPYWGHIVLLHNVNITIQPYNNGSPINNGDTGIIATTHSYGPWHPGDQGTTPYLFVIGLGGNHFIANQLSVVDGYYGMYGSSGIIEMNNRPFVYGRFEAAYVKYTSGDSVEMPYCPTPWEQSDSGDVPLETKYMVDYYEYH
ncbi:MAG: hypothetical protein JW817_03095 [Clostridiales bacterium]|nr:hypothetical protein [Clostridiales bacterium]